jgi:citrate synthase
LIKSTLTPVNPAVKMRLVTRYISASDAARRLGVERATLYAYVSRGRVARRRAADGRMSLFAEDDIERLAGKGRSRAAPSPPSVDVQISTAVTAIGEDHLSYRGWSVRELARMVSYEHAAELLWTGSRPTEPARWDEADPEIVERARAAADALGPAADAYQREMAALLVVASHDPLRADRDPAAVAAAGRRLIPIVATAAHPPSRPIREPSVAAHVAAAFTPDPSPAFVRTIDRAMVLLADHELASSTLAVRVAASTWADPYHCLISGLGVLAGPLHGAASEQVLAFLEACERHGTTAVLGDYLRRGERVPGVGHKVYRGEDPRVAPLLEMVRDVSDSPVRMGVVDEALALARSRLTRQPNVDFALGALAFVTGISGDVTRLFAVARLAGWLAHVIEEYAERPVRFRATGRYIGDPIVNER